MTVTNYILKTKWYLCILILVITSFSYGKSSSFEPFITKHHLPITTSKIILVVNGNDCINCYKAITDFCESLKKNKFQEAYMLVSDVNERQLSLFYKNLNLDYPFKKIIADNDFCKSIQFNGVSKAYYLQHQEVIYEQNVKERPFFEASFFYDKAKKNAFSMIDSIDVSEKLIGHAIPFRVITDSTTVFLDKLSGKLFSFNLRTKKFQDSLNVVAFLESQFDSLFLKRKNNDTAMLRLQHELQKTNPKYFKDLVYLQSITSNDTNIYISYGLWVKEPTANGRLIYRLPMLLELSSDLKFKAHHYIPQYMDNITGTYIDVGYIAVQNTILKTRGTSGKKNNDTLMCLLQLHPNQFATIIQGYKTPKPEALPKVSKENNLPYYYDVHLLSHQFPNYYYFNNYPIIYNLNNSEQLEIKTFKKFKKNPLGYYMTILRLDKESITIAYDIKGEYHIQIYSKLRHKEIADKNLGHLSLTYMQLYSNTIYGLRIGKEKTMLYYVR